MLLEVMKSQALSLLEIPQQLSGYEYLSQRVSHLETQTLHPPPPHLSKDLMKAEPAS